MKLSCLIVDDEPLAIKVIENYVNRLDFLKLLGTARNAVEAFNLLAKQPVDLLFLDIQMPQITGLEFIKTLAQAPKVIFTTAHREFAVESYELNALDYLMKPISFERFLVAVRKALPDTDRTPSTPPLVSSLREAFIYIKADNKVFKTRLDEILYVESFNDYIVVRLTQGEALTSYQSLAHLEKSLPTGMFLRIHRSYLINLEHLRAFSATNVHIGEEELPIGRTYKEEVLKVLKIS
ncbi:MAG: response regulator transcription factor [Microscillaceae bacterium]|nr:response regulator transcription factor [Microscillaceae bacterium]